MIAVDLTPSERLYLLRLVERQQLHFDGKLDGAIDVTRIVREFESKAFLAKLIGTLSGAPNRATPVTRGGAST